MKQRTFSKIIAFALAISILITLCFCFIPTVTAETNQKDEVLYNDSTYYDSVGEDNIYEVSFSYSTKSVKEYRISSVPYYLNLDNSISNTCANVVGAEVLAFYSIYTDTMDGYVAGQLVNNFVWYYSLINSPKIQETINELYRRMGTNSVLPGTSESEFEKGMNSYCFSRGLDIRYTNFVKSSILNYDIVEEKLRDNKVFVALMQNYNLIYSFADNNNKVSCTRQDIFSNHMMLVFGYSDTYYYDSNGKLIKHIIALDVANGMDTSQTKVFIDNTVGLNELKLIEISN